MSKYTEKIRKTQDKFNKSKISNLEEDYKKYNNIQWWEIIGKLMEGKDNDYNYLNDKYGKTGESWEEFVNNAEDFYLKNKEEIEDKEIEIMINSSKKVAEKMKKLKVNPIFKTFENCTCIRDFGYTKPNGLNGSEIYPDFTLFRGAAIRAFNNKDKKSNDIRVRWYIQDNETLPKTFKNINSFEELLNIKYDESSTVKRDPFDKPLNKLNKVNQRDKFIDAKEQVNSCKTIQDVLNIEYRKDMNCDATELYSMKNNKIAELVKELNNKQIINPFESCRNIADVLNVKFDAKYNISVEQFNEKGLQVIHQFIISNDKQIIVDNDIEKYVNSKENKKNPFEHCKTMDHVRDIYWGDYVGESKLSDSEYLKFISDKVRSILNKTDNKVDKKNPFENCISLKETYNILFDINGNLTPEEYFEFKKQTLLKFGINVINNQYVQKDGLDLFNNILKQLNLKNTSKLPKVHVVADFNDVEKIIQKLVNENSNHKIQPNEFGYINKNPLTDEIKEAVVTSVMRIPLVLNDIINDCGDLGYAIGKSLEIENIELFIGGLIAAITDKTNG